MSQTLLDSLNQKELTETSCTIEIQAAFILSSLATFFGGLIILFLFRIALKSSRSWKYVKGPRGLLELFSSRRIEANPLRKLYFHGVFRQRIEMLLSAQTVVGQVLVILVFVLSIGSLVIYFINSMDPVRRCSSYEDKIVHVDLSFNAFFSFYFGLRFWAAEDKIKFWLEMNSIVDIFTIPPTFISYYLKSNWLGLRFLRALRLLELPKILQILQVIKTSNSVKLSKLLSIVISTWFTAAGFLHLTFPLPSLVGQVENSGDPWLNGRNSQTMSYFESIYLVTATMSTVGFGDVVAKTSLGRIFIVFFTLGSLILFANYIPEMVELFSTRKKYTKPYEAVKGKKFIVVCGNITVDSVTAFLRNFLHWKSGEINIEIVFLGETLPCLELETLLKCHTSCTNFVCGTALKFEDLKRVAVENSEACLILANHFCSDLHDEDNSNIMRVLSIKNYYPQTRVIIQILQSQNKVFLSKIPNWDWSAGDNILCFAELKLGFIAQGCLVPGLCTFLTTLFIEQNQKVFPKHPWQKHFLNGLKNKILTQRLSNDFVGMTFPQVSRLCFVKLNLMLIAIQHKPFFHSCWAFFYCSNCHSDVCNPELIGKCNCKIKSRQQLIAPTIMVMKSSLTDFTTSSHIHASMSTEIHTCFSREQPSLITITTNRPTTNDTVDDTDMLDSSGMFHWCRAMPLDKVVLKRSEKAKHEFQNHIVVCVFGDAQCTLVGLRNFVMPLRASNYTRQELKDIVFIGSLEYFQREWRFLRNFPKIHIMPGSALYMGDLIAVNVEQCSMCVILATPYKALSSQILVDTEAIMATLNIQSLRITSPTPGSSKSEVKPSSAFDSKERKQRYKQIPILTELKNPSNIHFIEQMGGLDGMLKGTSLHLSTSFSTGAVFSDTFLDSLLATSFYNYHVVELLQMLVTGGISSEMEHYLVKEKPYKTTDDYEAIKSGRTRCKLGLLSLDQTVLSGINPRKTFGQLFCGSLDNFGILCVGLYRMIDEEEPSQEHKRFVITRPSNECHLLPSDLVFCAIPFNTTCGKSDSSPSIQAQNNSTNATTPLAQGSNFFDSHHADESHDLYPVDDTGERWSQHHHSRVYPLDTLDASDIVQEK
ncbi:potassium channel subfamily U member 1 isoform X2 [Mus musculus]|uniref:potassium channel subfamily U member 1 isoform X2 n=1 Tax=Mus musculus TaxID=10090 RepID=UPI0007EC71E9|nr:potassium channel subfamily U member 1 isoform X2 [Mus musculus]|eukprot:XP_017168070.1 PREDICTED: potassium channel subfamily U member 1 isoform X2 [Mus musculus]